MARASSSLHAIKIHQWLAAVYAEQASYAMVRD
jgi:hypothetical protein